MKLEKKLSVLFFIVGLLFIIYPSFRTGLLLGIETDDVANYCFDSVPRSAPSIECAIYEIQLNNYESILFLYRLVGILLVGTAIILFLHRKE